MIFTCKHKIEAGMEKTNEYSYYKNVNIIEGKCVKCQCIVQLERPVEPKESKYINKLQNKISYLEEEILYLKGFIK